MQRVISRSELELERASVSDLVSEADDTEALKKLDELEFVEAVHRSDPNDGVNASDEEVDFRLFAGPKVEITGPRKIRIRSPSVDTANPGFVRAHRDPSYYFANNLSQSDTGNLEEAALSSQQVAGLSKSYRPGSAYSWKVLSLSTSNLAKSLQESDVSAFQGLMDNHEPPKRKRPGKKARIKVRIKQEKLEKQQLAGQAKAEANEAAEREKRTRRNREKKVKKKMRDKAKKVESTDKTTAPPSND